MTPTGVHIIPADEGQCGSQTGKNPEMVPHPPTAIAVQTCYSCGGPK